MASPNTLELRKTLPRPTITVWGGHAKKRRFALPGQAVLSKPMPVNKPFTMGDCTYICDRQGVLRRHE